MLGPWVKANWKWSNEMARVNVNILVISKLKWTGMGEFNSDDHYIYYCGQESLRRNGVAIMVNKRARNAVLGCNLKNDRKISVRFQGKTFNITVIKFYAPTRLYLTQVHFLICGESVQFSCSVISNYLQPHGLQYARLPCPSWTPRAYSSSCPLSRWCHPTISSPVISFSSCLQSFPVSGSFPMSQFFASGGQNIGASASASVLPMNIQDWFL